MAKIKGFLNKIEFNETLSAPALKALCISWMFLKPPDTVMGTEVNLQKLLKISKSCFKPYKLDTTSIIKNSSAKTSL